MDTVYYRIFNSNFRKKKLIDQGIQHLGRFNYKFLNFQMIDAIKYSSKDNGDIFHITQKILIFFGNVSKMRKDMWITQMK